MAEISLTFIKSPFLNQSDEIWSFLEERLVCDFERKGPKHVYIPKEVFEEHYSHIREYSFFNSMIEEFVRDGINICAYKGRGIISDIRRVLGPTDPSEAGADTVRGRFSDDALKVSLSENRAVRNVMHASGNRKEGIAEFALFAPYFLGESF